MPLRVEKKSQAPKEITVDEKKHQLGQFMTSSKTADFMASFFSLNHERIKLLDAGAGEGALTIAFMERVAQETQHGNFFINCYEIDLHLFNLLSKNVNHKINNFVYNGSRSCSAELYNSDFIESATWALAQKRKCDFTHAILNPPYKKIHSKSIHRKQLSSIGIESPNLYSSFISLAIKLLKKGGELVAIIPRSFCNGNYYKPFRKLITQSCAIKRIHLFESRNSVFKADNVLQENIIIHLIKGYKSKKVIISHSTDENLIDLKSNVYSINEVIKKSDSEVYLHIPGKNNKLSESHSLNCSLTDLGLNVSTGAVVDFRAKQYLLNSATIDSAPLVYPVHFNGKEIDWPKKTKKLDSITINNHTKNLLYPRGYYVLTKRFSSKEEKQRIVARVVNPENLNFDWIGIENHLNVFHCKKRGVPKTLAWGLAAFLNSTYVDTYFRTFNGQTQVNATDLKQIKYPTKRELMKLGRWAQRLKDFDQFKIDVEIDKIL